MPEISNVKNAVQAVVKKDRFLNAAFAGGKSLVLSLARTFYTFYLQTTGLIFLLFTVTGVWDLFHHYRIGRLDSKRLWIEGPATVILAYFTVHSYWKAARTIKKK